MSSLIFLLAALPTMTVTVDASAPAVRVAPTFQGVFIEDVSHAADVLMSPTGFREEVVSAIAALRPGFVRFPGGCAAQGRTFEEQFDWKRTICPPAERPCVSNLWGYVTNFRLGFYEYFCLCERLGAEPVPVVAAGMTCHHFSRPQQLKSLGPEMDAVAQDACDLVEFANGDVATPWGAKRAAMGHPKPFGMKYLSIGNEDVGTNYLLRYRAMAKVLRTRHPEIRLIAAAHRAMERDQGYSEARQALTADVADVLDEHFYFKRAWLDANGHRFDAYPRTQRLAVTEYAHKEGGTENTPVSALHDMAFLLDLLRNADLVEMTSYAPLLAWKGKENWSPNLIAYDGKTLTLTANYEMQVRFAADRPQEVLPSTAKEENGFRHVVGRRCGRLQLQCVNLLDESRELDVWVGGRQVRRTVPARAYRCFDLENVDRVRRLTVPSPSMGRAIPVAVVLPQDYDRSARRYPVVTCLHGVGGTYSTFLDEPLFRAVDAYGFIAVCPQSGCSWWFDSPVADTNRFESFVASELVSWVDRTYRTQACRAGRALVGASMGGHGACWIGFRHYDVFGAVGNIYGGVDFTGFASQFGIADVLGPKAANERRWREHTALAASDRLSDGTLDLITCVGTKDFFLESNRRLNGRLQSRGVRHSYLEIAGCDDAHMSHHDDFRRLVEPIVYGRLASYFKADGSESFEDVERRTCLKPGPSPMSAVPMAIPLHAGNRAFTLPADRSISLDGVWQLVEEGCDASSAIPADVPGSVHAARLAAGAYGDPYYACNDQIAQKDSFRDWRMSRTFVLDAATATARLRLEFGGVCHACTVFLNGHPLGPKHVGMFGGPDFDVTGKVTAGTNVLEVLLDHAPREQVSGFSWLGGNTGWPTTVTFNCSYGWHYAQIPPLGIWQGVRLRPVPSVSIEEPFVSTVSTNGTMDFFAVLRGAGDFRGRLDGEISPANFTGAAQTFTAEVTGSGERRVRLRFRIPAPRLWWPNGMGEQNLYRLSLRFADGTGALTDGQSFTFGIRTVETRPAGRDGKPSPDLYNWKLVVNGTEVFMKGTGWCTMDALMRFTPARYARFLDAAKRQNVNFIRAWGGGLVETDAFYDLCDRHGLMVMQEWPTAWDSYATQPAAALEETVVRGVKRLRNRASLVFWCGGNEGQARLTGNVETLNLLGRRTIELDGTRPWHRQEGGRGFGHGSIHFYDASWGRKNLAVMLTFESTFIGEFGVDSYPCLESIRRYTPKAEWAELERTKGSPAWRIDPAGAVAHHTPKFNAAGDVDRLQQHVSMFLPANSLENVVLGSQIAQAVGLRHTLERARTRFPDATGAAMYKLNDVYPAASWATVDWYGVEKYASFVVADAFAPLTAIARLDRLRSGGRPLDIPLFVVDDGDRLSRARFWRASLRAYDADLRVIRRLDVDGKGSVDRLRRLGELQLTPDEAASVPLWVVADVTVDGELAGRNFYFVNFEAKRECLFDSPPTTVEMSFEGDVCVVRNSGVRPAINVHFVCPRAADRFVAEDNWFWLEPGESKRVGVNDPSAVERLAWWQGKGGNNN